MDKIAVAAEKPVNEIFPVVGIGASAGGMEAMLELLQHLSPDTGMAYVYVQHLDPSHESMLPSILAKATKMPVLSAGHLQHIQKNHVYIIPPNKDLKIVDGTLILSPRKPSPAIHLSVDKFFTSLAETHRESSIGIVLSGNANDGTSGLRAIKLEGGITFAQDSTAKFQGMPQSAIAEGVVDMILSPQEIAKELERISRHPFITHGELDGELNEDNKDDHLKSIIRLLHKSTDVDFANYKMSTIKRRIVRRMLLYKLDTLKQYHQYLKLHANEIIVLYQDLLINVTSFFRDPDVIEYLKKTLIPKMLKGRESNAPLRIWVPACSTGEEAYSLAIVICEALGDNPEKIAVQIFATDLSDMVIAKARIGLYSKSDMANVSPERLQQFFMKVDSSYRVVESLRDMCIFAPHNVLKDPPFSRLDLVSCCNLMIYMDAVLQKRLMTTFHYALNNNGYMVLGTSETIGMSTTLFAQLEKKYKIYIKKSEASAKANFQISYPAPARGMGKAANVRKLVQRIADTTTDMEKTVEHLLLREYVPASVVVNRELEILHFRGNTSNFLAPPQGRPSMNLLKMAKDGLALELRSLVLKADKSGEKITRTGLQVKEKDTVRGVTVEVVPLPAESEEKLFLVIFEDAMTGSANNTKTSRSKDRMVKEMQDELTAVREDMRGIIEEQEASMEELQSANEEIVSSNEELQTINEELETAKEELQSTNEELTTVNTEFQVRNDQLAEAYEYADAVIGTIREAVLILDKDFRVKSANKAFYSIFKTTETDTLGLILYELGNRQWNILKLRELLEEIVPRNTVFSGYEVTHVFPGLGEKSMVLNARRIVQNIHKQQLILLAIEDVTEHKKAERIISEREQWFRNMTDNAPVMIWVADEQGKKNFFNKTWLEYTGTEYSNEQEYKWEDLIHKNNIAAYCEVYEENFKKAEPFKIEYRLKRHDGVYRWMQETAKPTYTMQGAFSGYVGSCTEIHDKKIINEELESRVNKRTQELQEKNMELETSNNELEQYAYIASHDLQEPLRKIITFSDRLLHNKEALSDTARGYADKIISSADKMTRLIDDLLHFSKASRANDKFVKTDLNEIVKDILTDFEIIIAQKNAKITIGELPVIEAIPLQMQQLFHNIISNSLKFAREHVPAEITISAQKLPGDEDKYEIVCKDNGIGFNESYTEQIFVIFMRLNEKQKFPGTGIGLALCKKIVLNHGGEIKAYSKENEGATFHIVLPATQEGHVA